MSTVGDLIHSLDKAKVFAELVHHGADEDLDGYGQMWQTLLRLQPKLTDATVMLKREWSIEDPPKFYVDVSGIKQGDPQLWAIEYVEWQQWLAMEIIVADELQPMSLEEQLAHCLLEMSWSGFTQEEVQKRHDEIIDRLDEVKEELNTPPRNLN